MASRTNRARCRRNGTHLVVIALAASLLRAASAAADDLQAADDGYLARGGATLIVTPNVGVLANDAGAPATLTSYTLPAHGTLSLQSDGSFSYAPFESYRGPDSFTYTFTDAVRVYGADVPPLATVGGVDIGGSGFGSALALVPGSTDEVYGLTDCGPRVGGPSGTKAEPLPFTPAIGKFKLADGQALLEARIALSDADGNAYSGRNNAEHPLADVFVDLNGTPLPSDVNGYDPEGLVALPDGTFWASEEYGPFITHFAASGRQLARLSPFDESLPAELAARAENRGLEGLAITPDGATLVAIMQSALAQEDLGGANDKKIAIARIVTYRLSNAELHEYLYLLDDPATTGTSVSEITALSSTTFLVDERDSDFPPHSYKKLWTADLSTATDVGPSSAVAAARYNGRAGGLLIGGRTLERLVVGLDSAAAQAALAAAGITPVAKALYLDLGALLDRLDPHGRFFAHDKFEGVALSLDRTTLSITNDSDFGIDGLLNDTPPFRLSEKIVPATGRADVGEYLAIDLRRLPAKTATATVRITVEAPPCTGDCNGDGRVGIDELVLGVRIALGVAAIDACRAFDCGEPASIACAIEAVSASLDGCPAL